MLRILRSEALRLGIRAAGLAGLHMLFFGFYQKERPEGWTIEDEVMLLTLYLQKDIVGHASGNPIHTIMDWRQNVSKAINKTLDKLEDENIFRNIRLYDLQEYEPDYEVF